MSTLCVLVVSLSLIACVSAADGTPNAFHKAIRNKNLNELSILINDKASGLNERGPGGQTPVMAATLEGNAEAVRMLIEAGADLLIGENDGYTPVHGAGFQGRAAVLRVLHAKGVDLNHRHQDGFTGFHRACWGANPTHAETVKTFLELGVSPFLKGADGRSCGQMTENAATKEIFEAALKEDL